MGSSLHVSDGENKRNDFSSMYPSPPYAWRRELMLIFHWVTNIPSNLLKSVCTQNFLCAAIYQRSSIFRKICMKYIKNNFL